MKKMRYKKNSVTGMNSKIAVAVASGIAISGLVLFAAFGAGAFVSIEAGEKAPTGKASVVNDGTASGGSFLQFGVAGSSGQSPLPTPNPPTGGKVPVGSRVVFDGNYDTGDFSQWDGCQMRDYDPCSGQTGGYQAAIVNGGPGHETAARFEIRDGDSPFLGTERTEVAKGGPAEVRDGDERWYEFSLKFDENYTNPTGRWNIVMQWHQSSNTGSPAIVVEADNDGNLVLAGDGYSTEFDRVIGPVQRGVWVDYVLHAKFSRGSDSWAEVHENGVLKVPRYDRPTMLDEFNYLKMGIYRDPVNTNTQVVFQDGLRVTAP